MEDIPFQQVNIGRLVKGTAYGNLNKAYSEAMYSINRYNNLDDRQPPAYHQGFTFFTRPMMNLSKINISRDRKLRDFLSDDPVLSYIRCMLDHRLVDSEAIDNPLVDNLQFYIPIMSNNLLNLTGTPDSAPESYTSPAGSRKQQYNLLEGTDDINESLDLTITFKNTYEDAITKLNAIWLRYMSRVKENIMVPYTTAMARRYVDSHSRIWRLIMSEDKRFVRKIGASGPVYPDTNEVGKYFNVSEDDNYVKETKTHTIKFKCMGMEYDDPILKYEFNRTVGFFNPAMKKINEGASPESVGMMRLSSAGEHALGNRGYCRINLDNNELEWYVEIDEQGQTNE